ncbi:MAG: hypothetical protein NW237_05760 [Cyanobacteriota bacterium]|nr:hypothetical protein [Cyanobacteriota bacterium]
MRKYFRKPQELGTCLSITYGKLISKKVLFYLLALIMLVVILDLLLGKWGENRLPISVIKNNFLRSTANIVFMGDGRMASAIDLSIIEKEINSILPKENDLTFYNLAVGSTPIGVHYFLIRDSLQMKEEKPNLIIYGFQDNELTEIEFKDDWNLNLVSGLEDIPTLIQISDWSFNHIVDFSLKEFSHLYRYRQKISDSISKLYDRNTLSKSILKEQSNLYQNFYSEADKWVFKPDKSYLSELVEFSNKNDIKILLVEMPMSNLQNQFAEDSHPRKTYFTSLGKYLSANQISLFSFRNSLDDRFLPDAIHLSPEGAKAFSEQISRQVIMDNIPTVDVDY